MTTVRLLDDRGTGTAYKVPGKALEQARETEQRGREHFYIKVPHAFWTAGWVARLSGPGVAMLLVLLSKTNLRST